MKGAGRDTLYSTFIGSRRNSEVGAEGAAGPHQRWTVLQKRGTCIGSDMISFAL